MFFITVGGILTLILGLSELYDYQREKNTAYHAAQQSYQNAVEDVPLGGVRDAEITDPAAYRDEWRQERDLEAQRDMARWALWMMAFAGVGVVVTTAGVIYVAMTLNATREAVAEAQNANKIASQLAEAEVRPRIIIGHRDEMEATLNETGHVGFQITITFPNVGKSPAVTADGWGDVFRLPPGEAAPMPSKSLDKFLSGAPLFPAVPTSINALIRFTHDEIKRCRGGELRVFFPFYIEYRMSREQREPYITAATIEVRVHDGSREHPKWGMLPLIDHIVIEGSAIVT